MLLNTNTRLDIDLLKYAHDLIDTSWYLPLSLEQLSTSAGFSRHHFIRAFRRVFGITPHQYLIRRRIEKAQYLLAHTEMSVTDICYEVGFRSLGSFSSQFRRYTGHSPIHHRLQMQQKVDQLYRTVPACYIAMLGLDQTMSHTTEQFSRSHESSSQL
jgi:AraC-like DNA-binding protein